MDHDTIMPESVRLDPSYDGWMDQVIGWDASRTDEQGRPLAPHDWPRYVHADHIAALEARVKVLTEATDMAIKRLEMCCNKAWNGDARDFKRSLYGIFSEYRAALQENPNE